MRVGVLRSLLSQNAEFFDRPQYSNAACVSELSSKPPDVQAVSNRTLSSTELDEYKIVQKDGDIL